MKATSSSPTHRVGITELEILATIHVLDGLRDTSGLRTELASLRVKLYNVYNKIESGLKLPDYVPIGRPESKINLGALGASQDEIDTLMHGTKSEVDGKIRNNSAEMSDAEASFINWQIMATDEQLKNPPSINEFMPGGKYYEGTENSGLGDTSSNNSSINSTDMHDDLGTDYFLEPGSDIQDKQLGNLFNDLNDNNKE